MTDETNGTGEIVVRIKLKDVLSDIKADMSEMKGDIKEVRKSVDQSGRDIAALQVKAGIWGALTAVPFAAIVTMLIQYWNTKHGS